MARLVSVHLRVHLCGSPTPPPDPLKEKVEADTGLV